MVLADWTGRFSELAPHLRWTSHGGADLRKRLARAVCSGDFFTDGNVISRLVSLA
jgi:hypothetical protein